MSIPKIGSNITATISTVMNREAQQVRLLFKNIKPKNQEDEEYNNRRLAKKFLVKGRAVGNGLVEWDVFQLDGQSKPKVVGRGFAWQEEAIAFSRDRSLGRMSIGFKGIRGMFKPGSGGIVSADRSIELPGQKGVPVKQVRGGILVG